MSWQGTKAFAHVWIIVVIATVVVVSSVGVFIAYNFYTQNSNGNTIKLESLSLNPQTSVLTGKVDVQSNSQISTMQVWVNGTYIGSYNYSYMRTMMSSMMGSRYQYAYSMTYSCSPTTMTTMASYHFTPNRTYMITMMATFDDGSRCNVTSTVHT